MIWRQGGKGSLAKSQGGGGCHLCAHAAHLDAGDPDAHRSDDLQMVQDELLQFADAASLEEQQSIVCCLS